MEKQKMVPGETEIYHGMMAIDKEGNKAMCHLYFGNKNITEEGKIGSVSDAYYRRRLNRFLASAQGASYETPTEEELVDAYKTVRKKTTHRKNAQKETDLSVKAEPMVQATPEEVPVVTEQTEKVEEPVESTQEKEEAISTSDPVEESTIEQNQEETKSQETATEEVVPSDPPASLSQVQEEMETSKQGQETKPVVTTTEEQIQLRSLKKRIHGLLFLVGCLVVGLLFLLADIFGFLPEQLTIGSSAKEYSVLQVTHAIAAGSVIQEADLAMTQISAEEYEELSQESVVLADGSTTRNYPVLYNNRSSVIGKFAVENMKSGAYILRSDYSDIAETDTVITMRVDGKQVSLPMGITTAGKSSVNVYAIVTSCTETGESSVIAIPLGKLELEGRSLQDVMNAEGESILQEILQQTQN